MEGSGGSLRLLYGGTLRFATGAGWKADGVYLTEDADGLSLALTTTLEDGTPLKAAGQRRGLRERLLNWAGSDEAQDLPRRHGAAGGQ